MDPKELKRIFHRGKCLSLETMRMYNEGKLPSKTSHAVEEHLLECSLCASAIDGLNARRITDVTKVSGNINKRLAVYMNTPPSTPILSRFGVAMIVSSVVVAIGLTAWLLSGNLNSPAKELADTGDVTHYQPPAEPSGSSQPIPDNSVERSQNNGAVSVPDGSVLPVNTEAAPDNTPDLPPLRSGSENVATEEPKPAPRNETPPPVQEENTRMAPADPFLRIKSVVVYPPTTHQEKKKKSNDGGGGQLNRSQDSKAEFELDEMPTYPGGNEALKAYILANFKPQKEDKENLKRKNTGIMFQVNAKTGEVSGAMLSVPVSPLTDAELLRVIAGMPHWNPGKKRGTVDVMVGITFE